MHYVNSYLTCKYYFLGITSSEVLAPASGDIKSELQEEILPQKYPAEDPVNLQIDEPHRDNYFTSAFSDKINFYTSQWEKNANTLSSNSGGTCEADNSDSCMDTDNMNKEDSTFDNLTDQQVSNNSDVISNSTANQTRIACIPADHTEGYHPSVCLVNSSQLLESLKFSNDSKFGNCLLVFFYTSWCPFCAKVAPHYNALARVFPSLQTVAIDAVKFNRY